MEETEWHVDYPDSEQVVERGIVEVAGWVVDARGPVNGLWVRVGGAYREACHIGVARPDVAAAFPSLPWAGSSGWGGRLDLSGWETESVSLDVIIQDVDGSERELGTLPVKLKGARLDARFSAGVVEPVPGAVASAIQRVFGWALSQESPVDRVEILLDGRFVSLAQIGVPPPERGAKLLAAEAPVCGFESIIDLTGAAGTSQQLAVQVVICLNDGSRVELEPVIFNPPPQLQRAAVDRPSLRERRKRIAATLAEAALTPVPRVSTRGLVVAHSLDRSGASIWLLELLKGLHASGLLNPTVVAPVSGPLLEDFESAGIPVHVTSGYPVSDAEAYEDKVHELAAWAAPRGFSLVLANTLAAFLGVDLARRLGLPSIWARHEPWDAPYFWKTFYPEGMDPYIESLAGRSLREADIVTFVSDANRETTLGETDPARAVTIPNGIDIESLDAFRRTYDRAATRTALGIDPEDVVIVSLGAIAPHKGQAALVKAFQRIRTKHHRAFLLLVGDNPFPYARALRDFVGRAGLGTRVSLVSTVDDPYRYLGVGDLVVCPSDAESSPLAVLEAMAFGLPVAATAVGTVPSWIDDTQTGFLVPPRDVGALAALLDDVLSLPAERLREIGRRGGRLVREGFDSARFVAEYGRLISELLAGPRAGG